MQAVQKKLGGRSAPGEITHIKVEEPRGSLGVEGGIGIPAYHEYTRLRGIALMKSGKHLQGLHLNLIMTTEGSHHAEVSFFNPISNQDCHGGGLTTEAQTSHGNILHSGLPPNDKEL